MTLTWLILEGDLEKVTLTLTWLILEGDLDPIDHEGWLRGGGSPAVCLVVAVEFLFTETNNMTSAGGGGYIFNILLE